MFKREKKKFLFSIYKKNYILIHIVSIFRNIQRKNTRKKNPFSTFNLTFSQRNSIDILKFYELEYQTNKFNEFLIFSEYWF